MNFLNEAQAYEGEMRAFFEDLHRHPEPSHFENRTNLRVREQLKAHGIDMLCPKDNITIAVIHGAKPGKPSACASIPMRCNFRSFATCPINPNTTV